jgi:hypothetical protein
MVDDPRTKQKNKRGKDANQRVNLTSAIKISATPLLLGQGARSGTTPRILLTITLKSGWFEASSFNLTHGGQGG